MTPERWQQVKTALDKVLASSPTQRPRVIESVCLDDAELRSEVESLLAFEDEENGSFDEANLSSVIQDVFSGESLGFTGRKIGKYTILREIGVGGMGTVYLAERADGEFEQQVAIKFLRHGFSSKSARQRFAQERQILARLHHRFIAQLIDGGTTDDGTPYLAMEYVEGVPITDYCRENDLSINEKLDLFRNVCEAVSFAHRNLIVHRDLKPDNILITADGVPKLLDFGIAKLLSTTEVKATVTHQQALTPEYAAPEQLAGRDITTASDIYALGIILYELLTGTHPFRQRGMTVEQIWKSVVMDEPTRPSRAANAEYGVQNAELKTSEKNESEKKQNTPRFAVHTPRLLKGDLDTIVLKALRKEPERRYDSVERFSQDIKFYLKGFPISARPDTFRYRAGKFLGRNPLASTAVLIAFISLIGGICVAVYQAHQANIERARAEKRFNEVRTLANSFMFEINDKIEQSPVEARELLVSRAVQYLDTLAAEAGNDPALQSELATSYEKIGDIQSERFKPTLGKTFEALVSHQKSLDIRQKLFEADPQSVPKGLDVVKSYLNIGGIFSMDGRIGESVRVYTQAVDLCRRLLAEHPNDFNIRRQLGRSLARRGQSILRSGSLQATLDDYQEALTIYRQLVNENPSDPMLKHSLAIVLSFTGFIYLQTEETPLAVQFYGESLAIEEKLAEADKSIKVLEAVSVENLWYGIALAAEKQPEKALAHARTACELQQKVFDADQSNLGERYALADCHIDLARILNDNGQTAAAIASAEKARDDYTAVAERDRANMTGRRQIAVVKRVLADIQSQIGDRKNALANYQSAVQTMSELVAADPSNTEWKYDLSMCYKNLGEFYLKTNDRSKAAENFRLAEPLLQKLVQDSPENILRKRDYEKLKIDLAKVF